ncbi:Solute carrier 38 member, partial [Perkinsus olseni]
LLGYWHYGSSEVRHNKKGPTRKRVIHHTTPPPPTSWIGYTPNAVTAEDTIPVYTKRDTGSQQQAVMSSQSQSWKPTHGSGIRAIAAAKVIQGQWRRYSLDSSSDDSRTGMQEGTPTTRGDGNAATRTTVIQQWLRRLIMEVAARHQTTTTNNILPSVSSGDSSVNDRPQGDDTQGVYGLPSSSQKDEKIDNTIATSVMAKGSASTRPGASNGKSGNSYKMPRMNGNRDKRPTLSDTQKRAVVDRLKRVLDDKQGRDNEDSPAVEVLDRPIPYVASEKGNGKEEGKDDNRPLPTLCKEGRRQAGVVGTTAAAVDDDARSPTADGSRMEKEVSLRIPQRTIRKGISREEVMRIVWDELQRVVVVVAMMRHTDEYAAPPAAVVVVSSYGPTSTSDGSVVISFLVRGHSIEDAIRELEAQVKDPTSSLRTGPIGSILWDKEERYRLYEVCRGNSKRNARVVRSTAAEAAAARQQCDDDMHDSGDGGSRRMDGRHHHRQQQPSVYNTLRIDTDKHHFILCGNGTARVLLPEDTPARKDDRKGLSVDHPPTLLQMPNSNTTPTTAPPRPPSYTMVDGVLRIPGCGIKRGISMSRAMSMARLHLETAMPGVMVHVKHIQPNGNDHTNITTPDDGIREQYHSRAFEGHSHDQGHAQEGHVDDGHPPTVAAAAAVGPRSSSILPSGSIRASVLNLSVATLGAGALSLPICIARSGVIIGSSMLILQAWLCIESVRMITACLSILGKHSYEELVVELFGQRAGIIFDMHIILFSFGTGVGYLITIGDIGTQVAIKVIGDGNQYFPFTLFTERTSFLCFITVVVLTPLCLVDTLSSLRFVCLIGMVCIVYLMIVVVMEVLTHGGMSESLNSWSQVLLPTHGILPCASSIALLTFAFCCQTNVPAIFTDLDRRAVPVGLRRFPNLKAKMIKDSKRVRFPTDLPPGFHIVILMFKNNHHWDAGTWHGLYDKVSQLVDHAHRSILKEYEGVCAVDDDDLPPFTPPKLYYLWLFGRFRWLWSYFWIRRCRKWAAAASSREGGEGQPIMPGEDRILVAYTDKEWFEKRLGIINDGRPYVLLMKNNGKVLLKGMSVLTMIGVQVLFCHHGHYDPNLHDYGIRKAVREEMERRENAIIKIAAKNTAANPMLEVPSTSDVHDDDNASDER